MRTFLEILGHNIFRYMRYNNLRIEDLSKKVGLSCNDILRVCCGELILSPHMIEKFAEALNITKSELIDLSKKGDWISCKDMMPEDNEKYLDSKIINCIVTTDTGVVTKVQRIHRKNYDGKYLDWYWGRIQGEVLAWMPLPPRYKED